MMTIDDAIKHEEERAADLESTCTLWKSLSDAKGLTLPSDYEFCKSDAEDHRQVAAWLKELKALKEAPKGDLISRDALREDLRRFFPIEVLEGIEPKTLFAQIMHDIDNAPTVDTYTIEDIKEVQENSLILGAKLAQRPQGEWIIIDGDKICPFCMTGTTGKANASVPFFHFCPYCGADLRKHKEEEPE